MGDNEQLDQEITQINGKKDGDNEEQKSNQIIHYNSSLSQIVAD